MSVARQNGRSNLEALLIRLRHADRFTQSRLLREMCVVVSEGDEEAMSLLLEYVTSGIGIEICSKLFGVLAVAVTNNPAHCVQVASCPDIYDAARRVLSKGLAERSVAALGLLALLQGGGEGRGSVAVYARERVRLSGCFYVMSELLFKDVMYANTWKALCICLAASCNGCETNQTACSHILPACIAKCSGPAASGELLQLLQALVEGHASNQRLFLQCNGILIFTRQVLVRSEGSWLLKTLLKDSPETARYAFQAAIPQILAQLCTTHGRQSKVGQWCSVCLYYITAGLQTERHSEQEGPNGNDTELTFNNLSEIGNIAPDVDEINLKQKYFNTTTNREGARGSTSDNINRREENIFRNELPVNTYDLISNVKKQKFLEGKDTFNKEFHPNTSMQTQTQNTLNWNNTQDKAIQHNSSVDSYSQTTNDLIPNHKPRKQMYQSQIPDDKNGQTTKCIQASFNTTDISEFIPQISSTPDRKTNLKRNTRQINRSREILSIPKHITPSPAREIKTDIRKLKRKTRQVNISREILPISKHITKPKDTKLNQALGSKLLRSFNATCGSVVQAFKGYFPNKNISMSTITAEPRNVHRSTSFTDFMQKFTALASKPPKKSCENLNFSNIPEFDRKNSSRSKAVCTNETRVCKTCNDTVVLQNKLNENKDLRDTVKKLKLGINLHGCNFKKIAKVYWKDDPYITSAVLYNLYRKLIVKKPSEK